MVWAGGNGEEDEVVEEVDGSGMTPRARVRVVVLAFVKGSLLVFLAVLVALGFSVGGGDGFVDDGDADDDDDGDDSGDGNASTGSTRNWIYMPGMARPLSPALPVVGGASPTREAMKFARPP